jgi:hypothetical protein
MTTDNHNGNDIGHNFAVKKKWSLTMATPQRKRIRGFEAFEPLLGAARSFNKSFQATMAPVNVVYVLCSQGATSAADARLQPSPSASRSPSASGFNHTPAETAGESLQQNECHILSSILSAEALYVPGAATTGDNREEGGSGNSAAEAGFNPVSFNKSFQATMAPENVVSVLCSQGATAAAEARPQPPPSASRSPSTSGLNHTPAETAGESLQQNECHILSSILSAEILYVSGAATTGGNREEGGSGNSAAGTTISGGNGDGCR